MALMFVENPALRHQWYVVAEGADVTDAPVGVRLLGADYVVWRSPSGDVTAAPDRCPHRESPLSIGTVEHGCLRCPYHGWTFGDGGRCVEVPSSGRDRPIPPTAHLATVSVVERYGLVWLCPDEPEGTIPSMSVDDDPSYRRINTGMETWATSATRMTDNFMDIAHFPWVHLGTFGVEQHTDVPALHLEALDDGWFGYRYEVEARNDTGGTVASGQESDVVHRRMSTGFHLPFSVRSTIQYDTGLDHVLLLCSTPVDDTTSSFTFVVWRNDDFSTSSEEIIAFDRAIGAEDKVMLERVPGVLPLDQQATVSVQSDRPSVEWRRQLAALIGS
jgi:phenylpropionate dioxygenase-like ring-hydroxylating dioxygenase large terminal subunit